MRKKRLKLIFILALPILLKYVFFLVFVDWGVFDVGDVKEDIIFFGLITLLIHTELFQKQVFKYLLLLVYVFYVVLETTSFLAVSSTFSSSYMYLLLESSSSELKEFAGGYFSWSIFLAFITNGYLFFMLRKKVWNINIKYSTLIGFIGLLLITAFLKFTGLIESNAYHNVVRGTYGYYELQKNFNLNRIIDKDSIEVTIDNENLVIVIGESATISHMEIYGYDKPTTPFFLKIKDSLYIYNDVISSDVFTLKSVPKILTSKDKDIQNEQIYSIAEIFNSIGYDSYWLSNQRPISYHDNAINKMASQCKYFKFYNHLNDEFSYVYDEVILNDYKKILRKPGKKIIFIKLIGSHFNYDKRYPDSFNEFDFDDDLTKQQIIINQYDNSILYTDYILSELISNLSETNKKNALLYTSDHGENLYNDGTNFFGRSEETITRSMFQVPFILWTSKSFNFPNDFKYEEDRSFIINHTYESLGHLFGVKHKSIDYSKSIFSSEYKPKKRTIVGNKDYDAYFKNLKDE